MDVLRLFDLNPEKIAAITADGVSAMTGKMNGMEGENIKVRKPCAGLIFQLIYLFLQTKLDNLEIPWYGL